MVRQRPQERRHCVDMVQEMNPQEDNGEECSPEVRVDIDRLVVGISPDTSPAFVKCVVAVWCWALCVDRIRIARTFGTTLGLRFYCRRDSGISRRVVCRVLRPSAWPSIA